jgi:uncharacterized protein YfdQ (DUF2303 family)
MSSVSDTAEIVQASILSQLEPKVIGLNGREFLVVPTGEGRWTEREITLPNVVPVHPPKIITQAVRVQTVESMIAYVNRFKNADSALFADISTNTVLGIIDYHQAGIDDAAKKVAAHTKHTASLTIPHSLEWQTWMGIDGRLMSHAEFSNFLEENSMDIVPLGVMHDRSGVVIEDAPTTILELCRELQVRSSYGAASEIRNGDYISIEMQKGDDVTTKRNVQLPVSINLNIPVYFGEQTVLMTAFMRRKVVDGSLRLGIKLQRPEQLRQDEFKRIVSEIEAEVMLTTLYGKPA